MLIRVIYRQHAIADRDAHDLMVRAVDVGVCPVTVLPKVVEEWREPTRPQHFSVGADQSRSRCLLDRSESENQVCEQRHL